jgi:microcystin-dependent protein
MTTYTVNNIDATIKIGTFIAVGNTSSFTSGVRSDGWIICDGVQRTNTNGIYTNLANLGIGTLINGNADYTPPNLNGRILTGKNSTSSSVNINTTQGTNSIILTSNNLPQHNHSITIANATHSHTYNDNTPDTYSSTQGSSNDIGDYNCVTRTQRTTNSSTDAHTHNITIDAVSTTTDSSILIKNLAFHIKWIVKYA